MKDVIKDAAEALGYRVGQTLDVPLPERGRIVESEVKAMSPKTTEYHIDLDPVHRVIRLTVTEETVTTDMAEEIYHRLMNITRREAKVQYAAIHDLSAVKHTTIDVETVRAFGRRKPAIPQGTEKRPLVIVGEAPAIFGLARVFEMCNDAIGGEHTVVHSLEEAYKLVGAQPEDFTERL